MASWAIDSEPIRARGIIVKYSSLEGAAFEFLMELVHREHKTLIYHD